MPYKRLIENPLDLDAWKVFYDYLQDSIYILYSNGYSDNPNCLPLTEGECLAKLNVIKYIIENKKFPIQLKLIDNYAGDLFPLHLIFPEIEKNKTLYYYSLYNNEVPNLLCNTDYLFNTKENKLDKSYLNRISEKEGSGFLFLDNPIHIENKTFENLSFFREDPTNILWENNEYRVLTKIPIKEEEVSDVNYCGVYCRYCENMYFFTIDVDSPDKKIKVTKQTTQYGESIVPSVDTSPFKHVTNLEEILDNLKHVGYLLYESSPGAYWIITDLIVSADDISSFRPGNTPISNWGDRVYQKVATMSSAYVLRAFPKILLKSDVGVKNVEIEVGEGVGVANRVGLKGQLFVPREVKYKRGNKYLHEFRGAFNKYWEKAGRYATKVV